MLRLQTGNESVSCGCEDDRFAFWRQREHDHGVNLRLVLNCLLQNRLIWDYLAELTCPVTNLNDSASISCEDEVLVLVNCGYLSRVSWLIFKGVAAEDPPKELTVVESTQQKALSGFNHFCDEGILSWVFCLLLESHVWVERVGAQLHIFASREDYSLRPHHHKENVCYLCSMRVRTVNVLGGCHHSQKMLVCLRIEQRYKNGVGHLFEVPHKVDGFVHRLDVHNSHVVNIRYVKLELI